MSSEVVVQVAWGPRAETPVELAQRWLELLGQLTDHSGGALSEWRWQEDAGPGEVVPANAEGFAAALEAVNTHDDLDILGYTHHVIATQPDGGYARVRAQAGGTNEYSPFTASLTLFKPAEEAATPLAGRYAEALAVLGGVWDADRGAVYDWPLYEELESEYGLRPSHPRCGWAVYLSANRAARVPGDFPARRIPTTHGGVVLDLAAVPGETPSADTVLAAHKALADCGALEPLPVPAPRAKL
ncbi:hypothetical protein ACWCP6_05460 [Streptomyces sp. NPDC002004]